MSSQAEKAKVSFTILSGPDCTRMSENLFKLPGNQTGMEIKLKKIMPDSSSGQETDASCQKAATGNDCIIAIINLHSVANRPNASGRVFVLVGMIKCNGEEEQRFIAHYSPLELQPDAESLGELFIV